MTHPHPGEPAAPDPGAGGLVRLRLDLGYDGSAFSGWARQPGRRTVQDVVEQALGVALRLAEAPAIVCAGRTDAGVHARGQVVHVDVPVAAAQEWSGREDTLRARVGGLLPPDVRVTTVVPAPEAFDARFAALARHYAYRVDDHPAGVDPLRRHDVLGHRRPLDLAAMNAAAVGLLGEHDFAAFCRARPQGSTVRDLRTLAWRRDRHGLAVADVAADAFCHSMVRALVGALLAVGDGRRPVAWPGEVLRRRVRDPAVTVAPAHGLTLERVVYPADAGLAARVVQTRATRGVAESSPRITR